MRPNKNIKSSRLHCSTENNQNNVFFSLVDYKNSYFTSSESEKMIEFYNGFENLNQLISWMQERPSGITNIYEVDGKKDIILVIPTANFNGEYSLNCRNDIFKGLFIIFVESGGLGDYYFNIAHNINVGIKKAMAYEPKWIVFSGDDMIKVDPILKLANELLKIDSTDVDVVFTPPSIYHSVPMFIGTPNIYFLFAVKFLKIFSKRFRNIDRVYYHLRRFCKLIYFPRYEKGKNLIYTLENFMFFNKIENFINTLSFGIFSSNFVKKSGGYLFDENYINEMEDTDLSIRVKSKGYNTSFINYHISEHIGSTLGKDDIRTIRVIPSWAYFSYKVENNSFIK